ncbi:MAG: porin [Gammaproteobacteria bacterium]|nr:porin [Gammaproteobacteria bacterium]MBU0772545.1 porin [Gammaproteobacteria bacterium]MBU0855089.1 porin [Gammaproteobacteria bacterium]MBU1847279.1 porin [Gammaproteobacteria bacterium]
MSKKLLAAAIAAALAPAAVMAEASNVTIYGRIDYGFMSRGGDNGGNAQAGQKGRQNGLEDGIAGSNRLGFKGSEDLGNGLKAIFEFEFGFAGDTGSSFGGTSNRHSWVGLTGNFGTVLGGRVDGGRYSFVGQYDPFKNQTVANAGSLFGVTSHLGQADRADNAIVYITPEVAPGLKFLAAYTTSLIGEDGSNPLTNLNGINAAGDGSDVESGDTPLWLIAAMYNNGPISFTLDYENLQVKRSLANGGSDLEFDLWVVGASYDFGVAKLSAYYENVEGDDTASKAISESDGWLIGLSAPVTSNITLKASYVKANDDTGANRDCSKWGFGGEYAFSKRTTAYATYAKLDNDSAANCGISKSAAGNNGTASATGNAGYGDSGFNIGIAHTF